VVAGARGGARRRLHCCCGTLSRIGAYALLLIVSPDYKVSDVLTVPAWRFLASLVNARAMTAPRARPFVVLVPVLLSLARRWDLRQHRHLHSRAFKTLWLPCSALMRWQGAAPPAACCVRGGGGR
jgi:hypothetical protein